MPVRNARKFAFGAALVALAALLMLVTAAWVGGGPAPASAATTLLRLSAVRTRRDAVRVEVSTGVSEARYRAQEVLSGRGFNEAVGRTTSVSGGIVFDDDGGVVPGQSRVTVDLTGLQSDNAMRDRYIQRATLQTSQFPTAEFQVSSVVGLPHPLPATGSAAFTLAGDLTIHGVTRPVVWEAAATFDDGEVAGSASTTVLLTDFGMEPPRAGPVLSIEDAVRLELDVRGVIAPLVAGGRGGAT